MMKPLGDLTNTDPEVSQRLQIFARERLRDLGITIKAPKKRVFPVTPMKTNATNSKFFGRPLRDLPPQAVVIESGEVEAPHFLTSVINYLNEHKDTEGLFRIAGSKPRQKLLQAEVEKTQTFCVDNYDDEHTGRTIVPHDVANLLKTWLRELLVHQEPLIPYRYHEALFSAASLPQPDKAEAILLICLLLPPIHAASLSLLCRFLLEVSESQEMNKMDSHNLALLFNPCLFPVDEEGFSGKKNPDPKTKSFNTKVDLVEILINHGKRVCMIDDVMEAALNIPTYSASHSEDNLEDDQEAITGPSERRRKKHKRRSGSLSRVLKEGINKVQKAFSRSSTPSGTRTSTVEFSSPSVVPSAKRRANDFTTSASPTKQTKSTFETAYTPRGARNRSISIRSRFKPKKALTGAKPKDGINSACNTPLPSKPTLASLNLLSTTTPKTPIPFELNSGQDLSQMSIEDALESSRSTGNGNDVSKLNNGVENSTFNVNVSDRRPSKEDEACKEVDDDDSALIKQLPASPSQTSLSSDTKQQRRKTSTAVNTERKIGIARRRSPTETTQKKNAFSSQDGHQPRSQHRPNVATFDFSDDASVKSRLRREQQVNDASKSSPTRFDSPLVNSSQTMAGTMPDKNFNESIKHLQKDISSLIEGSFGGKVNDTTASISPDDNQGGIRFEKFTLATATPNSREIDFVRLEDLKVPTPKKTDFTVPSVAGLGIGVTTRSSIFRRQSSAFEFSRPESEITKCMTIGRSGVPSQSFRRQSSAFEIGAKRNEQLPTFERGGETRSSLKQRNSSVKDLVMKLESAGKSVTSLKSLTGDRDKRRSISVTSLTKQSEIESAQFSSMLPPLFRTNSSPQQKTSAAFCEADSNELKEAGDQFEFEWIDASEFFSTKTKNLPSFFTMDDGPSGTNAINLVCRCKRSSIVRIRNEKKGLVSKSIETFTKPALMATPSRIQIVHRPPPTTTTTPARRASARMGVATAVRVPAAPTMYTASTVARRQTLTGIKTTPRRAPNAAMSTAATSTPSAVNRDTLNVSSIVTDLRGANLSSAKKSDVQNVPKSRLLSDRRHDRPVVEKRSVGEEEKSLRKSKRLEGRRHLTIGYAGEMRSPLHTVEQNLLATVQRSKSAQTPNAKPSSMRKREIDNEDFFVLRSSPATKAH